MLDNTYYNNSINSVTRIKPGTKILEKHSVKLNYSKNKKKATDKSFKETLKKYLSSSQILDETFNEDNEDNEIDNESLNNTNLKDKNLIEFIDYPNTNSSYDNKYNSSSEIINDSKKSLCNKVKTLHNLKK